MSWQHAVRSHPRALVAGALATVLVGGVAWRVATRPDADDGRDAPAAPSAPARGRRGGHAHGPPVRPLPPIRDRRA